MTIVFENENHRPATHAMVIGVGSYSYLPDGRGGRVFSGHESMGQLSSPPRSARQFADWLIRSYRNAEKPLGSVDLLISDDSDNTFTSTGSRTPQEIERATFGLVTHAIMDRWVHVGDSNPDHLLIFFFCGHGVSRGHHTSLLMEDFGELEHNPLQQAISFRDFYIGMDQCHARQQVYFIDCCQMCSTSLIERYDNFTGQSVFPPSARYNPIGPRKAPIYNATIPGQPAFGRPGQLTVYTEALLNAFDGAGSRAVGDDWMVHTDSLNQGMDAIIRRTLPGDRNPAQTIVVDGLQSFLLHTLDHAPLVPVTIGCCPTEANSLARLGYFPENRPDGCFRDPPVDSTWEVSISAGDYYFSASFENGEYHDVNFRRSIYPPENYCWLKVTP